MQRREFIVLLGGSAAAGWPFAAHAQQPDGARRIGVIMPLSSNDPEAQARLTAFKQALQRSGWTEGRNVRIDYRWGAGDADLNRRNAAELITLAPDVILATGTPTLEPLERATRTVPIVFVQVADPVGAGLVKSLARPGGNATGFSTADYAGSGKWLELLKEIAPNVRRAAVLRDAGTTAGIGQWATVQAGAPSLGVEVSPVNVRDPIEIEHTLGDFARDPNGGLVVTASGPAIVHRQLIIALAARQRLPAVYPQRVFVTEGGLISYGHDTIEPYRDAARYVDRILKGEKPADLPVQAPTKYQVIVNLKTAKALGLTVPSSLLGRADETIE